MITLDVISDHDQHGILTTTEAARFEFIVIHGRVIITAYSGSTIDSEQEPNGCYDGTLQHNHSWETEC